MTMQLSNKEAKTILLARKYARIQNVVKYVVIGLCVALFLASTDGLIDVYFFRALTIVVAAMLLFSPYNGFPSYKDLLTVLEQKT